jgi:hypothetical protein
MDLYMTIEERGTQEGTNIGPQQMARLDPKVILPNTNISKT